MIYSSNQVWVNLTLSGIVAVLKISLLIFFIHPLAKQKRSRLGKYTAFILLWSVISIVQLNQAEMNMWMNMLIGCFAMVCFIGYSRKSSIAENLFLMLVFYLISDIVKLFLLDMAFPVIGRNPANDLTDSVVYIIFLYLGSSVIVWWVRRYLKMTKRPRLTWGNWLEVFFSVIPYSLIKTAQSFYYSNDITPGIYYMPLCLMLTICDLIMILLMEHNFTTQIMQRESEELSLMLEVQLRKFKEQENSILEINKMYHDMKKHFNCIQAMSDNEAIKDYVSSITSEMQLYEMIKHTENETMDIMIARTNAECAKLKLTLVPFVNCEGFDAISPKDLCVILGNALDNACEAASRVDEKEKREIVLRTGKQNQFLLIRVENYYQHSLITDSSGQFETTKKDAKRHGFGLKSIRSTVEKYGGEVVEEIKGEQFVLTILIPAGKSK